MPLTEPRLGYVSHAPFDSVAAGLHPITGKQSNGSATISVQGQAIDCIDLHLDCRRPGCFKYNTRNYRIRWDNESGRNLKESQRNEVENILTARSHLAFRGRQSIILICI